MLSQYTNDYLSENKQRGEGKGITVSTYLSYNLRGEAKRWAGRYACGLVNSLQKVGAKQGKSKCNGIAYYPAN